MATELKKKYLLGQSLGRGSYAIVTLGKSIESGQIVAVKKFFKSKLNDFRFEQAVGLFLTGIDDPTIVKYIESIEDHDAKEYILILEYVKGRTLSVAYYATTTEEKLRFLYTIIRGVAILHDRDIVHADLHEGNIIVRDGRSVIIDFGLARQLKTGESLILKDEGLAVFHRSPEFVSGFEINKELDCWSIGVLAYEIFYEEKPFDCTQKELNDFEKEHNIKSNDEFNVAKAIAKEKILALKYELKGSVVDDFISRIFVEKERRLTAKEMLEFTLFDSVR